MRLQMFIGGALLLIVGGVIGWVGSNYWAYQIRKAESMLALGQANTAAQKGDLDSAIQLATQSYTLYPDSLLAGPMMKELIEKRAGKAVACPQK